MTRDQRLFMVAAGEGSTWEALITSIETAFSRATRRQCRRYAALRGMFGAALADPDDTVTVRIRKRKPGRRVAASAMLLALLTFVLLFEWGAYTLPAVSQYMGYVAHRCGLR